MAATYWVRSFDHMTASGPAANHSETARQAKGQLSKLKVGCVVRTVSRNQEIDSAFRSVRDGRP